MAKGRFRFTTGAGNRIRPPRAFLPRHRQTSAETEPGTSQALLGLFRQRRAHDLEHRHQISMRRVNATE